MTTTLLDDCCRETELHTTRAVMRGSIQGDLDRKAQYTHVSKRDVMD